MKDKLETLLEQILSNRYGNDVEIEVKKRVQEALVHIRNKYGKNAVLKGMNFYEKATQFFMGYHSDGTGRLCIQQGIFTCHPSR